MLPKKFNIFLFNLDSKQKNIFYFDIKFILGIEKIERYFEPFHSIGSMRSNKFHGSKN